MCPPVSTVHAGYFGVSVVHQTLTWTSGFLTCVRDHSGECVYTRGLGTHRQRGSMHNIKRKKTNGIRKSVMILGDIGMSCHTHRWYQNAMGADLKKKKKVTLVNISRSVKSHASWVCVISTLIVMTKASWNQASTMAMLNVVNFLGVFFIINLELQCLPYQPVLDYHHPNADMTMYIIIKIYINLIVNAQSTTMVMSGWIKMR